MASRKIVQIAVGVAYSNYSGLKEKIVALADDGTAWEVAGDGWRKLPPIPQESGGANG